MSIRAETSAATAQHATATRQRGRPLRTVAPAVADVIESEATQFGADLRDQPSSPAEAAGRHRAHPGGEEEEEPAAALPTGAAQQPPMLWQQTVAFFARCEAFVVASDQRSTAEATTPEEKGALAMPHVGPAEHAFLRAALGDATMTFAGFACRLCSRCNVTRKTSAKVLKWLEAQQCFEFALGKWRLRTVAERAAALASGSRSVPSLALAAVVPSTGEARRAADRVVGPFRVVRAALASARASFSTDPGDPAVLFQQSMKRKHADIAFIRNALLQGRGWAWIAVGADEDSGPVLPQTPALPRGALAMLRFCEPGKPPAASIRSLFVEPRFAGEGVYESLADAAVNEALCCGLKRVYVACTPGNEEARRYWVRGRGFRSTIAHPDFVFRDYETLLPPARADLLIPCFPPEALLERAVVLRECCAPDEREWKRFVNTTLSHRVGGPTLSTGTWDATIRFVLVSRVSGQLVGGVAVSDDREGGFSPSPIRENTLIARKRDDSGTPLRHGYISFIGVAGGTAFSRDSWRGQRLGSFLLNVALEWLRLRGDCWASVVPFERSLMRWYESHGFVEVEESPRSQKKSLSDVCPEMARSFHPGQRLLSESLAALLFDGLAQLKVVAVPRSPASRKRGRET